VPGGVGGPFTVRAARRAASPGSTRRSAPPTDTLELLVSIEDRFERELARSFGDFPRSTSPTASPTAPGSTSTARLRIIDGRRAVVVDQLDPADYREVLGEAGKPTPTSSPLLPPARRRRRSAAGDVPGRAARPDQLAERFGTPVADEALAAFRERVGASPPRRSTTTTPGCSR
jgi:NAD-reducing hydrogenase large subunit